MPKAYLLNYTFSLPNDTGLFDLNSFLDPGSNLPKSPYSRVWYDVTIWAQPRIPSLTAGAQVMADVTLPDSKPGTSHPPCNDTTHLSCVEGDDFFVRVALNGSTQSSLLCVMNVSFGRQTVVSGGQIGAPHEAQFASPFLCPQSNNKPWTFYVLGMPQVDLHGQPFAARPGVPGTDQRSWILYLGKLSHPKGYHGKPSNPKWYDFIVGARIWEQESKDKWKSYYFGRDPQMAVDGG